MTFGSNVQPVIWWDKQPEPWRCNCPDPDDLGVYPQVGKPQPAYKANCPDCWARRPK